MDQLFARVCTEIDQRQGGMVSLLQALVRERSVLGRERSAQEVIHAKWQSLGLASKMWEPTIQTLAMHPAFAPVEWDYQGRPNVTAILRSPAGCGRSLVLNGHMDVVSPEPVAAWTHDPWEPEIVDGRMYGRGTADMKGGIAMIALALDALRSSGVVLQGDLIVETVLEEECGGNGTLACRLAGHNGDGAIVCEPHALRANIATMGVLWFRIRVRGSGAHVLRAHQSVNAIEKCFPLVMALKQLEEDMNQRIVHPLYVGLEHPINMNLGKMRGGDWPSNVPALCEFECRISYVPGVRPSEVQREIETCIAMAASRDPWLCEARPEIIYYGFRADGCQVDTRSPLVQILQDCHRAVVGDEVVFDISTACNDIRYFNNYFNTPAVAYGPRGAGYHGADEYVELDTIVTGAKVLSRFIMEWCGVVDGTNSIDPSGQE